MKTKNKNRKRKNITEIRVKIIDFLLDNTKEEEVSTRTIEKGLHSNNLTIKPHLNYWASQTVLVPIKIENRIVGWKLNTDLLGLLLASKSIEKICNETSIK